MQKSVYTASEAARALGISLDTLRRWDREGRIRTRRDSRNRRLVAAAEVERLRGAAAPQTLSARNRLHGVVEDVRVEGLLAQVEIRVTEAARVVGAGTPAAYLLALRRFPGRSLVLTLIELPLVLPPAVAGIALLAAFGRAGLLGGTLDALGLSIPFTQTAVVLAVAFVEAPFYVRGAIAAFEAVDRTLLDAARTLGAPPARVFARIALPLALGGLGAASAVALARGLGEFGARIILAGRLQRVTQTPPLAIYAQFDQ